MENKFQVAFLGISELRKDRGQDETHMQLIKAFLFFPFLRWKRSNGRGGKSKILIRGFTQTSVSESSEKLFISYTFAYQW